MQGAKGGSFPRVIIRKHSSETYLDPESNPANLTPPVKRGGGGKKFSREEEGVARSRLERSIVAEFFSRNARNDLSLTISPRGGGSRARWPARGNSYVIVYDKYEKEERPLF